MNFGHQRSFANFDDSIKSMFFFFQKKTSEILKWIYVICKIQVKSDTVKYLESMLKNHKNILKK